MECVERMEDVVGLVIWTSGLALMACMTLVEFICQ